MDIPEIDKDHVAWCQVDDRLIFLDIAQDRYFCLPEERNTEVVLGLEAGDSLKWFQPASLPRPSDWTEALRTSPHMEAGRFRLGEVARGLWMQRRVESRLAASSLSAVLHELQAILEKRTSASRRMSEDARTCVRAFEQARLIRTAAERCLPRSIALALVLAGRGCRSQIVIGVKSSPFAAHCWVQHFGDVLTDSVEEVRRYQPILIL